MAQTIYCDGPGDSHAAAYLLQRLDGSGAPAFCEEHWLDFARFMIESVDAEANAAAEAANQAELDATAADALARLEGGQDAPQPLPDPSGSETGHIEPIEGVAGQAGPDAADTGVMTDGPDDDEDDDEDRIAPDRRPGPDMVTSRKGRAAGRHR